MTTRH
jgi:hypothetical protein